MTRSMFAVNSAMRRFCKMVAHIMSIIAIRF
jgi:hypothetical protein